MRDISDTPIFNLQAVVNETGIKPDTLRAWERRYGMPAPRRTPGGHRLYSQRDIDALHWLLARLAEGVSISRAVEMWASRSPARRAALAAPAQIVPSSAAGVQPALAEHDKSLRGVRNRWLDACLRFDEQAAEQVLALAFALFPPEMVCLEIIQKGLSFLGDGWYRGEASVQQEHFASSLALRRLGSMLTATPPPTRPGRILIGCPPDEEHTFPLLLTSLLLRRRGWETIYLGGNVPLQNLAATVAAAHAHLVVLAAQQLSTAAGLLAMANVLQHERVPLAYGGLIFNRVPGLQRAIPGVYAGSRIDSAIAALDEIMAAPSTHTAALTPDNAHSDTLARFVARRAEIEGAVQKRLAASAAPPRMLNALNHHFGCSIEAALAFGNLDCLTADLEWLEGLPVQHGGVSPAHLQEYLAAYRQSVTAALGARPNPLSLWFAMLAGGEPG